MTEKTRSYETKDVTLPAGNRLRYYEWQGAGPNLILLHSSGGYALMYEWTAAELGDKFHIYAPDQRGHGDSDKPDGDYSANEYAEDLHQFIKTLGIGSAVVAGLSLGARAAQVLAATHPEDCQAILCVSGVHASNFFHERDRAVKVMEGANRMLNSTMEFPSREAVLEQLRATRRHDTEASHAHRIEHNMYRVGDGYRFKYDNARVAQGLQHMNTDLRPYAPKVECPVVLLRSTEGSDHPTLQDAKDLAQLWKRGSAIDVEGDYLLNITSPGPLAAAITSCVEHLLD